jgi:hypothetical protein
MPVLWQAAGRQEIYMSDGKSDLTIEWNDLVELIRAIADVDGTLTPSDDGLNEPSLRLIKGLRVAIDEYDAQELIAKGDSDD